MKNNPFLYFFMWIGILCTLSTPVLYIIILENYSMHWLIPRGELLNIIYFMIFGIGLSIFSVTNMKKER